MTDLEISVTIQKQIRPDLCANERSKIILAESEIRILADAINGVHTAHVLNVKKEVEKFLASIPTPAENGDKRVPEILPLDSLLGKPTNPLMDVIQSNPIQDSKTADKSAQFVNDESALQLWAASRKLANQLRGMNEVGSITLDRLPEMTLVRLFTYSLSAGAVSVPTTTGLEARIFHSVAAFLTALLADTTVDVTSPEMNTWLQHYTAHFFGQLNPSESMLGLEQRYRESLDTIRKMNNDVDEFHAQIADLRQKVKTQEDTIKFLEEERQKLVSTIQRRNEEIVVLARERDLWRGANCPSFQAVNTGLRQELSKAKDRAERLDNEIYILRSAPNVADRHITSLQTENAFLLKTIGEKNAELLNQSVRIEELKASIVGKTQTTHEALVCLVGQSDLTVAETKLQQAVSNIAAARLVMKDHIKPDATLPEQALELVTKLANTEADNRKLKARLLELKEAADRSVSGL